jgi:hypothetical protein
VRTTASLVFAILAATGMILVVMGVVRLLFKVLRMTLGGIGRFFRGGPGTDGVGTMRPGAALAAHRFGGTGNVPRICTNPKCRHVNRPEARFCAQCGARV